MRWPSSEIAARQRSRSRQIEPSLLPRRLAISSSFQFKEKKGAAIREAGLFPSVVKVRQQL
jgi:hypothetical protein